jgi:hypothetical protein
MVVVGVVLAGGCKNDSPVVSAAPRVVTLASIQGSTASGAATILDDAGPSSTVQIDLTGMQPNTSHVGHVHKGSCAAQGAIYHGLAVVNADAGGNGTVSTAQVPDSLLIGGYYIQYHTAVSPPGTPIACGDLPQ